MPKTRTHDRPKAPRLKREYRRAKTLKSAKQLRRERHTTTRREY